MAPPTPKHPTPRVFAHSGRADWGRAVVSGELVDRRTFVFENVGERTFMHGSAVIVEIDVPQEERNALAAALLRHTGVPAATKKKSSTPRKKRVPKPKADKADPAEAGEAG